MGEFTIKEMLEMQEALQNRYKGKWEPITAQTGQNKLLWMIGEVGEVIDIIKKHGSEKALEDPQLRAHLVEEMTDVLMHYGDVMLCYSITEEELHDAYRKKFERNMTRW